MKNMLKFSFMNRREMEEEDPLQIPSFPPEGPTRTCVDLAPVLVSNTVAGKTTVSSHQEDGWAIRQLREARALHFGSE